jgi:hypothetical protein
VIEHREWEAVRSTGPLCAAQRNYFTNKINEKFGYENGLNPISDDRIKQLKCQMLAEHNKKHRSGHSDSTPPAWWTAELQTQFAKYKSYDDKFFERRMAVAQARAAEGQPVVDAANGQRESTPAEARARGQDIRARAAANPRDPSDPEVADDGKEQTAPAVLPTKVGRKSRQHLSTHGLLNGAGGGMAKIIESQAASAEATARMRSADAAAARKSTAETALKLARENNAARGRHASITASGNVTAAKVAAAADLRKDASARKAAAMSQAFGVKVDPKKQRLELYLKWSEKAMDEGNEKKAQEYMEKAEKLEKELEAIADARMAGAAEDDQLDVVFLNDVAGSAGAGAVDAADAVEAVRHARAAVRLRPLRLVRLDVVDVKLEPAAPARHDELDRGHKDGAQPGLAHAEPVHDVLPAVRPRQAVVDERKRRDAVDVAVLLGRDDGRVGQQEARCGLQAPVVVPARPGADRGGVGGGEVHQPPDARAAQRAQVTLEQVGGCGRGHRVPEASRQHGSVRRLDGVVREVGVDRRLVRPRFGRGQQEVVPCAVAVAVRVVRQGREQQDGIHAGHAGLVRLHLVGLVRRAGEQHEQRRLLGRLHRARRALVDVAHARVRDGIEHLGRHVRKWMRHGRGEAPRGALCGCAGAPLSKRESAWGGATPHASAGARSAQDAPAAGQNGLREPPPSDVAPRARRAVAHARAEVRFPSCEGRVWARPRGRRVRCHGARACRPRRGICVFCAIDAPNARGHTQTHTGRGLCAPRLGGGLGGHTHTRKPISKPVLLRASSFSKILLIVATFATSLGDGNHACG